MSMSFRRGLLAVAGLTALAAGPALAHDWEKPPGVPPEVEEARQACPTVASPCYGYHPTRWRSLPPCSPPAAESLPPALPPASRGLRDKVPTDPKRATTAGKTPQWPAYPAVSNGPAPRFVLPVDDRPTKAWITDDGK
jgi:hypothetical protein